MLRRLRSPRLQQRYAYTPADVDLFRATLRASFIIVSDLPWITALVRDLSDEMILASAVAVTKPLMPA